MQFEIKNVKFGLIGRCGVRSFQCDIFFENKKIGTAEEQGNGGSISIFPVEPYDVNRANIKKLNDFYLTQPSVYTEHPTWESSLEEQISRKAFLIEIDKEVKTKQKKFICYRDNDVECQNGGYKMLSFGKLTIEQVLAQPGGLAALKQQIEKIQAEGSKILNTNLGSLQILIK
jgi:hypothetical protein